MAYVEVPKDLGRVKTKVAFGLTKRQLIGFGIAVAIGIPTYLLAKKAGLPDEVSMMVLFVVSAPSVVMGMYEKDEIPAEEWIKSYLKYAILRPKVRKYKLTKANKFIRKEVKRNAKK